MEEVLEINCFNLQITALRPTGVEWFRNLIEIVTEGVM